MTVKLPEGQGGNVAKALGYCAPKNAITNHHEMIRPFVGNLPLPKILGTG